MWGLLLAPEMAIFAASLALMLAIGVVEALGLGASGLDLDLGVDVHHGALDWLGIGRVPLIVLLIAFLASFGMLGLVGQHVARTWLGGFVSPWIAAPAAGIAALPLTGVLGRILGRIMPHDETSAFELEDLVGRTGTVVVGRAAAGSPARIRVVDPHGQAHHVLVEPNDGADSFGEGDTVLLVRREGHHFRGVLHATPRFSNWID